MVHKMLAFLMPEAGIQPWVKFFKYTVKFFANNFPHTVIWDAIEVSQAKGDFMQMTDKASIHDEGSDGFNIIFKHRG